MTTIIFQNPRKEARDLRRLLLAAAAASLFFHAGLIFFLKDIPFTELVKTRATPPGEAIRLEFIDSPRRVAKPDEEPRKTNLISDQASQAQDVIPDKTERTDSPRAVGDARVKSIRKVPSGGPKTAEEQMAAFENKPRIGRGTGIPAENTSQQARQKAEKIIAGDSGIFNLRGADKFPSPEADDPDGKTRILKQVAYNTRAPAVGKYLARIKPRIVNLWYFKVLNNTFHVRSDHTSILFKIMPDGGVGGVRLNEHVGPPPEMLFALKAVEEAGPFAPLPIEVLEHIKDDGLWLEFNFLY